MGAGQDWGCAEGFHGGLGRLDSSPLFLPNSQNIMPLSAAMFQSERKNPAPQCPPRLEVQMLMPVSWSRMPNHFLHVDTRRAGERLGWAVQCQGGGEPDRARWPFPPR